MWHLWLVWTLTWCQIKSHKTWQKILIFFPKEKLRNKSDKTCKILGEIFIQKKTKIRLTSSKLQYVTYLFGYNICSDKSEMSHRTLYELIIDQQMFKRKIKTENITK
jgi:hypothetical protein